ncbi:MAG: ketosteroid isomerase [Frankiales bacterium]|nr:ketosteroid isomerase [Frankiales bacterium]
MQGSAKDHEYVKLLDRIIAAAEAGDPSDIDNVYAPDAVIWHSHDGKESTVEQNKKLLVAIDRIIADRVYDDRRVWVWDGGVAQTHTLRGTRRSDGAPIELHAIVVCQVSDGRITRLDEYIDPEESAQMRR